MLHTLTLKVVQLELALPQQVLAPHAGPREHEVVDGSLRLLRLLIGLGWNTGGHRGSPQCSLTNQLAKSTWDRGTGS